MNKSPKLQFETDRKAHWDKASEAYIRWHTTGDIKSKQAQSWMAGYVSSIIDAISSVETKSHQTLYWQVERALKFGLGRGSEKLLIDLRIALGCASEETSVLQAEPIVTEPIVYMACERHKSSGTYTLTVPSSIKPLRAVCPGCEQESKTDKQQDQETYVSCPECGGVDIAAGELKANGAEYECRSCGHKFLFDFS